MAAKKNSDPAKDNEKPKRAPAKSTARAKAPATKKTTPKKPAAKKTVPPKKAAPAVDDDFGLDDIELNPVDGGLDAIEEVKKPSPKPVKKTKTPAKPRAVAKPKTPAKAKVQAKPKAKVAPKAATKPKVSAIPKPTPKPKVEATPTAAPIAKPAAVDAAPINKEPEKEDKRSNNGLIIFFVLILAAAAVYFLVFDKEEDVVPPVIEKVEQAPVKEDPTPKEVPVKQEEVIPEVAPEPKAELVTISSPDGRFYVVVGSFYDDDLAIDKANEIVASGISAYVLEPDGEFNLYRVGISVVQERSTAFKARAELLNEYGENIWVLKY